MEKYNLSKQQNLMYEIAETLGQEATKIITKVVFKEKYDLNDLYNATKIVVEKNQILHGRLCKENEIIYQNFDIDTTDIVKKEKFSSKEELKEYIAKLRNTIIDPYEKLANIIVFENFNDEKGVIFDVNHIVFDGYSVTLFAEWIINELKGKKYDSFNYIDIVAEKDEHAKNNKEDIAYWVNEYKNTLPFLLGINGDTEKAMATKIIPLDKNLFLQFYEFCKKNNLSIEHAMLTTISFLIHKLYINDDSDLLIKNVVHNRNGYNEKNTLGFFPMRYLFLSTLIITKHF